MPDFGNMPELFENMITQLLSFGTSSVMTGTNKITLINFSDGGKKKKKKSMIFLVVRK